MKNGARFASAVFAALLLATVLNACSEGSEGSTTLLLPSPTPAAPTPTPSPTPTPTPTPTPGIIGTAPGALSFTVAGATATFTVSDPGFTGTLTAANGTPSCAGIASVTPATGTGPIATFTVTANAAGQCQIKVTDTSGNSGAVSVTVTTTGGIINVVHPH